MSAIQVPVIKAYESAYAGSMHERATGDYLHRDDHVSLVAALLELIVSRDRELEDLREAVAGLRADAENYRWLRAQNWDDGPMCVVMSPATSLTLGSYCPSMSLLDDEIKAARAAS